MAIPPGSFAESGVQAPYAHAESITPADSELTSDHYTRAIYIGGTGDLAVKMAGAEGDSIVIFEALPVGTILPIRVSQIRSTNTTATLIIALW